MNKPTAYYSEAAIALRAPEIPNSQLDGCSTSGSNACGIGIAVDGGAITGEDQQFTLLDQFGNTRQPQLSQFIGGVGYTAPEDYPSSGGVEGFTDATPVIVITNDPTGTSPAGTGTAGIATLEAGWQAGTLLLEEGGEAEGGEAEGGEAEGEGV